jgi:hypothetical protein
MLTDKEMAEAKAAYDALPGTPHDAVTWRKLARDCAKDEASVRSMAEELQHEGITHMRLTRDDAYGYLWMEGWKYRPYKEASFSPQYTHTPCAGESQ